MANHSTKDDPEWIDKVKSEGAVPLLDPDNCSNGWASPPGDIFMVRGPEYCSTKAKVPGGDYLLKPLGFDWIKGSSKLSELLNDSRHRIRKAIEDEFPSSDKPYVWAFNLQVPSKENFSAVAYFVSLQPFPEGALVEQFLQGDDAFRSSRLKLIANIAKGPWLVRKSVGEQAICIIGRALTCKYCQGENFIEVDIDIGSSVVANAIVHLAFGYLTTLTVDLAFLIESQTESELPERILGAVRFSELNAESARPFELPSEGVSNNLQSSLPTRLWKSIGQGFSHLIHTVPQESGSSPGTSHVNGLNNDENSGKSLKDGYVPSPGTLHVNGFNNDEKSGESLKDGYVSSPGTSHVNGFNNDEKSGERLKDGYVSSPGTSHVNGFNNDEKSGESLKDGSPH
ncbi:hypothetical protein Leryth_027629 [Lithospermum erythrorhizon]|nr:hypothetical protein Leryth_027629 [Lithospermum erythrorhizon]